MSNVRRLTVRKRRVLPAPGEVFSTLGERVMPDTLVARGSFRNPDVREIRLDLRLGVDPGELRHYLLKGVGGEVKRDEVIAVKRSFLGRTQTCRSPVDGTIEAFSPSSGQLLIRGSPIVVEVRAHIPGEVVEVIPREGAVVEAEAETLEGVFGVGGEAHGEVALAVEDPGEALTETSVEESQGGKILVGGSTATLGGLRKAREMGVKAVIVGGVDEKDLVTLLGYELGFGMTGGEALGLTIIATEGFGVHPMGEEAFSLLRSSRGRLACVDGATQIRARMLRPEVILPLAP